MSNYSPGLVTVARHRCCRIYGSNIKHAPKVSLTRPVTAMLSVEAEKKMCPVFFVFKARDRRFHYDVDENMTRPQIYTNFLLCLTRSKMQNVTIRAYR